MPLRGATFDEMNHSLLKRAGRFPSVDFPHQPVQPLSLLKWIFNVAQRCTG
jgi:hypothetical protein